MNLADALKNSKGEIFYGMHFYPGVAQYDAPEGSFRVFINEDTIRKLNPTFAGRPVFVEHVDGVDDDLAVVRNEADGWVIESFFNEADGKTWAKFIIVSDRGLAAIRRGFRLSNAYVPQLADTKATWNGVDYQKVVTGGEFEHLAIVNNPRYEESVIMTPDEFKAYNANLKTELYRLANSKDKKERNTVKFFKRQKLENAIDIESTMVELPKSKKEMTIARLVNDHDAFLNMNGYANGDHMVKINDKDEMSVNDLVKAYQKKLAENAKGEDGGEPGKGEDEVGDLDVAQNTNPVLDISEDGERDDNGDLSLDNEDDEEDGDGVENDAEDHRKLGPVSPGGDNNQNRDQGKTHKNKKVKNAAMLARNKAAAARLRNAHLNARDDMPVARVDLAEDQIARGKARYGSN